MERIEKNVERCCEGWIIATIVKQSTELRHARLLLLAKEEGTDERVQPERRLERAREEETVSQPCRAARRGSLRPLPFRICSLN